MNVVVYDFGHKQPFFCLNANYFDRSKLFDSGMEVGERFPFIWLGTIFIIIEYSSLRSISIYTIEELIYERGIRVKQALLVLNEEKRK